MEEVQPRKGAEDEEDDDFDPDLMGHSILSEDEAEDHDRDEHANRWRDDDGGPMGNDQGEGGTAPVETGTFEAKQESAERTGNRPKRAEAAPHPPRRGRRRSWRR